MAETSISWTHTRAPDGRPVAGYTFNPWIGCQKVSPACDGCYAEHLMSTRLHRVEWGPHGERQRTSAGYWRQPLRWQRKAVEEGTRPFVFCASLADVFDNKVPQQWRKDLFELIRATPNLVWLLLTKRPQNIPDMVEDAGGLPENVGLGTTAEDQQRWDTNIPALACAKAVTHPLFAFVSIEPMLGPINPRVAPITHVMKRHFAWSATRHDQWDPIHPSQDRRFKMDFLITGGETDQGSHKARPSHPDWFRTIRDACAETATLYHHKQNGEWAVASIENGHADGDMNRNDAIWVHVDGAQTKPSSFRDGARADTNPIAMFKMGAKRSGRLLDGVEHIDVPMVTAP